MGKRGNDSGGGHPWRDGMSSVCLTLLIVLAVTAMAFIMASGLVTTCDTGVSWITHLCMVIKQ